MGNKIRNFAPLPTDLSLEELVPKENFYRRLDQRLDLSFVSDLVEDRYACSGRPSVDPGNIVRAARGVQQDLFNTLANSANFALRGF